MGENKEYPQYVNHIINGDILKREKDDPVRIAYFLAVQLHEGQYRKGIDKLDYITHPVQVYDLVNRCLPRNIKNKDVTLAASLLHDVIEDYKKEEIKSGSTTEESARKEVIGIIESKFDDKNFAKKLIFSLHELTNPKEFRDSDGNSITKTQWQVQHIGIASPNTKLIKICDKTMNIVSNIEEVPNWNYDKLMENSQNSKAVVDAAKKNITNENPYYGAINLASGIYSHVANGKMALLSDMLKDNRNIPPQMPIMSFSFNSIIAMVKNELQNNMVNR